MTPAFTQSPSMPPLAPAPVAFHSVSEHDEAADQSQAHRPQRKRQHDAEESAPAQPELQMVETSIPAPDAAPVEDDLPRRTKPRRRRSQAVEAEPLKLVETQPGTQENQDGAPTP